MGDFISALVSGLIGTLAWDFNKGFDLVISAFIR